MKLKQITSCVLIALAFAPFFHTLPQTAPGPAGRPKVGLILSGGGARGFAHIGVLRVLEENRIPVDYIGGASMGALVGAMYSIGYTPDEMEKLIGTLNWDDLFRTGKGYDDLSFRRKEDRRNIPAPLTLQGKIGDLKLPNALNSGKEIGLLLDRITLPYAEVRDFDKLPIPFRAVATDMVNGQSVTLSKGSLSRALRATMSIPGIFAPVEMDGRILADGGLVNNIPTDVVKAMGADILLVVNIETQLSDRESLESILGVLSQTINIASSDNSRRSLQQANLIIAPELGKFKSSDFSDYPEIIRLGQEGAKKNEVLIKGLGLSDNDWRQHLAVRNSRDRTGLPPVSPAFIEVDGKDRDAVKTIEEKLADKYTGKPLDAQKQAELEKDLLQLTGTGRFDVLNYDLKTRGSDVGLLITTDAIGERPRKPARLEVGIEVNSVEADNVNFNFRGRLTLFDIGRYGTEWRNDLVIGSTILFATEYFRPIAESKFFIAPRASYERNRINIFQDGERLAEYVRQDLRVGIDAGYSLNPRSELRLGVVTGYQSASRRIGDPLLPDVDGGFSAASLRWNYDSLNQAQVPTNGVYSKNALTHYFNTAGAEQSLTQAETRNFMFRPMGERNILMAFGGAGTSFGSTAPFLQQFTLGGPFRLGGYGYDEFRSSHYISAGGGVLHNPKMFPTFFGGKIYVGGWYEGGSAFETWSTAHYRQSFSAGGIVETPIGPFFLGTSINENGNGRLYFSFGRVFH